MPSASFGRVAACVCAAAVVVWSQVLIESREPMRDVLLAVQDTGWIDVLDATTLATLGRIRARPMAMRVAASPDGRTLFVNQAGPDSEHDCCALYAFELATKRTCSLLYPSQDGTPSPDGRWLFAQRGNVGIDVFDVPTLGRLPALQAPPPPIAYTLHPSPDGRWLFGQVMWQDRWIDVFDLRRGVFARRVPVTGWAGAWLGDTYYVLGAQDGQRVLTRLAPETGELSAPVTVADSAAWSSNAGMLLTAGGARLFAWTRSAPWLMREGPLERVFRGIRVLDPATARVERHLAPDIEIADLSVAADGAVVFAAAAPAEGSTAPATLMRIDLAGDAPLTARPLPIGFRSLTAAALPRWLVPSGDVTLSPCRW